MRIASLVPSATEMCAALGLGGELVAVTHECDYPPAVRDLPQLTRSVLGPGLTAAEIDAAVLERTGRGEALYELDEERLTGLRPDLIITQEVCPICAVAYEDVLSLASRLPGEPRVLSLDPSRLDDVLADAERVALAAGRPELGTGLRAALQERIAAVTAATGAQPRPRVAALEWLDPVYAAGHWVPEMIAAAGGVDALARPGERSRVVSWEEVAEARPQVLVVMPCGLYRDEALAEATRHLGRLSALGAANCFAVDAAASFSRPGPRLADGVELLGHLLHPEAVPAPRGLSFATVELQSTKGGD